MLFVSILPLIFGNDTLFMTFGDYENLNSIGWICYINDFSNIRFEEMARFALSTNFFSWIGFLVFVTAMISKEYQQGTLTLPVVYGVSKTQLFIDKLIVLNVFYFIVYFICEIITLFSLGIRYQYQYTIKEFFVFLGVASLNALAMIGFEVFAVLLTVLIKNAGIVMASSCVWFFAGAITYPMVYENLQNRSIITRMFCVINPTTYMYNICGYRISLSIIVDTIAYAVISCFIGFIILNVLLKRQEI